MPGISSYISSKFISYMLKLLKRFENLTSVALKTEVAKYYRKLFLTSDR